MQIILSPAKTQKFTGREYRDYSLPLLQNKTKPLIDILKKLSRKELAFLFKSSDKLTDSTLRRIQAFTTHITLQNCSQALFTFQGDVYSAIASDHYSDDELRHAQKHLFILSALHGILRPLDLIQPYRLDMTTRLAIEGTANLYQYWRVPVTDVVNRSLADAHEKTLINLASGEYSRMIDRKGLQGKMVTITFKENYRGTLRTIAIHAKRARGLMVHYIISNRISDPRKLKDFNGDGYTFRAAESTEDTWVFGRAD